MSWWQIGIDVIAMAEAIWGHQVDPHNCEAIHSGFGPGFYNMGDPLTSDDFAENSNPQFDFNPAHQAMDKSSSALISTTGIYSLEEISVGNSVLKTKRLVYTVKQLDNGQNERKVIAEIDYPDVENFEQVCASDGILPENSRLR